MDFEKRSATKKPKVIMKQMGIKMPREKDLHWH